MTWLQEQGVAVCDDVDLVDALDAWAAMRDQRDQARAWAARLFELAAAVEDVLAGDGQAVLKVAAAQTLLAEASTLAGAR